MGIERSATVSSWILALLLITTGLSGCGPLVQTPKRQASTTANADSKAPSAASLKIRALVQSDIAAFANIQSSQVAEFEAQNAKAFSEIFGGTTGADVLSYFQPRIQHFITADDELQANVDINSLPYSGWLSDETHATSVPAALLAAKSNAKLGGQNVGTEFWFISIINRTAISFYINGVELPVSSSRVGLMLLGEAYATSLQNNLGETVPLPLAYRQGILVHEARHSDCTGGVTEADLDVARGVGSMLEFTQKFPKMECGHFHSICPDTMEDVGGLAACDDRPWGAYTVGYVYQKALWMGMADDNPDKAVLEASAIDSFSRLQFKADAMMSGADGPPDMSTSGLLDGVAP